MADPEGQRQLLVIMFTDVVGYTALTERDEAAAVRIRDLHRELVQRLVSQFGGEVAELTGDESLSIFPSALRAVDCALALQAAVGGEPDLRVRIGVHLGDVLRRDGEVIGEGVNVAARIRPLAEPGGICISEAVAQVLPNRDHIATRSLGPRSFKNVRKEITVYAVSAGEGTAPAARPSRRLRLALGIPLAVALVAGLLIAQRDAVESWLARDAPQLSPSAAAPAPEATPPSEPTSGPRERSLAVLPFVNMSLDPSQEYFSDGLSEEILNLLAKVPTLKVIARTSSFAFKGKNEDARTIGRALGVNTLLEGSVRIAGDRVRITAQLVDVSTGTQIFSESYDRTLTDIFAVQESVANAILAAMQIHVGTGPTRGRPTQNAAAYALFLEARAALNRYEEARSIELLRKAIGLDPTFAEAYEQLALSYWYRSATVMDAAGAQRGQYEAASRALAIDPDLRLAQALFESGKQKDTSHLRQIEAFQRALIEKPNHQDALDTLFWKLMVSGYFDEALRLSESFVELDPLSPLAHFDLARALVSTGRRSEALASLQIVEKLGVPLATWELGFFHLRDGRDEAGIGYLEAYLREQQLPSDWVRELVAGARDPATGRSHIERRLRQIGSVSGPLVLGGSSRFYLAFGFLDRYFDRVFEAGLSSEIWSHGETLLFTGTVDRGSGFTAHPRYLEAARVFGLLELWEQRGPPDYCERLGGRWVCE